MKRLVLMLCLVATPLFAVQPDEVLDDPFLEQRARDISADLRCLVCRNESIDESNAELARDMRLLVRERLVAGDTDRDVVEYIVDRYGEYVLLNPVMSGSNMVLWLAAPVMFGAGVLMAGIYVRNRSRTREDDIAKLSEAEKTRLREILKN
jgi:cytochrome c-type biogenesis protein CcmH